MSKNIQGKVVVITGASSGLGEATARHLAALATDLAQFRHPSRRPHMSRPA